MIRSNRSGFGLLEVLLATAIFIVVVGSVVALSRLSLRNAILSTHRTQATNLAEDALEALRQMRDTNWIDGPTALEDSDRWKAFVHACDNQAGGTGVNADCGNESAFTVPTFQVPYRLAFDTLINRFGVIAVNPTDTASNPPIILDPASNQSSAAGAQFTRTIIFEPVDSTIASDPTKGLQIITGNDQNMPQIQAGVEPIHFISARVIVSWKDFDQSWSVELKTLLTNWQPK